MTTSNLLNIICNTACSEFGIDRATFHKRTKNHEAGMAIATFAKIAVRRGIEPLALVRFMDRRKDVVDYYVSAKVDEYRFNRVRMQVEEWINRLDYGNTDE